MSAFMVGEEHITALVDLAIRGPRDKAATYRVFIRGKGDSFLTPTEMGRLLWSENLKSLKYRYPYDKSGTRPGPIDFRDSHVKTYEYVEDEYDRKRKRPTLGEAMKILSCYEYQSCEHPGWDTSKARRFCFELWQKLARMTREYKESTAWEWTGE